MTILYVEDNDDNVYMLTNRLRRAGFTVIVATEGRRALQGDVGAACLILMDGARQVLPACCALRPGRMPLLDRDT